MAPSQLPLEASGFLRIVGFEHFGRSSPAEGNGSVMQRPKAGLKADIEQGRIGKLPTKHLENDPGSLRAEGIQHFLHADPGRLLNERSGEA